MSKKLVLTYIIIFFSFISAAQELNCRVQVTAPKIGGSEQSTFQALQQALTEFMNNRRWTEDVFSQEEKIECSILINITEQLNVDEFKATIQIQSSRPVYNTTYKTPVINYKDESFQFKYLKNQVLQYSENSYVSNLTAVMAFYAYYIIGMDYETFSLNGGEKYLQKARDIVNYSQSSEYTGWRAFDNKQENRYWLIENHLNPQFKPYRQALYQYHRKGLDVMSEKLEEGRKEILASIELLQKVWQVKPNNLTLRTFFFTKADEIVNIFSEATPDEKQKVKNILMRIDAANGSKYQKIK